MKDYLFILMATNVALSCIGLYKSYKMKNIIFFVWLILAYFSVTTIVEILGDGADYSLQSKITLISNMTYCLLGFLLCDYFFNKKVQAELSFDFLHYSNYSLVLKSIEVIYWISLLGTFIELRTQSYATYNTGLGAGWFQVFFQTFSCMLLYFAYRKQWLKIVISAVLVTMIVAVIGVRSLLYFVLLPLAMYYIIVLFYSTMSTSQLIRRIVFALLVVVASVFMVDSLRFGNVSLPETELTGIALEVLDSGTLPLSYINSVLHYFAGLFKPIINALNMFGLGITQFTELLPPSIPRLNAVVTQQVQDVDFLVDAAHMPASIYFDLLASWGKFACIAAFFVYWYLLKLCTLFQRNAYLFFAFSGILGWHLFMLLRGSVDGCIGGLSYSIWICLFLFFYLSRKARKYGQS